LVEGSVTATPRWTAAVAFGGGVLSWVVCVWGSPGTVGWFDAPELAAAGQQLGVAHSPGEPGYLLLVRLAQLIPLGDLASRAVWLASLCVAGLVGSMVWLTRELRPETSSLSLAFVAVASSLCGPLWIQGILVELYGLQALVTVTALLVLCLTRGGVHGYAIAGALVGFGAALNPLLTVLALPGMVLLVVARHRRPTWTSAAAGRSPPPSSRCRATCTCRCVAPRIPVSVLPCSIAPRHCWSSSRANPMRDLSAPLGCLSSRATLASTCVF